MNPAKLAKVYLDNQPLDLEDAKPKVATILFASGKPTSTNVQWLKERSDPTGKAMQPEEVVDRTAEPTTPIYLTSVEGGTAGRTGDRSDISQGGVAPVPKGESGGSPKASASRSDKNPDSFAKQEATRKNPDTAKAPKDPDGGDEAPVAKDA